MRSAAAEALRDTGIRFVAVVDGQYYLVEKPGLVIDLDAATAGLVGDW